MVTVVELAQEEHTRTVNADPQQWEQAVTGLADVASPP